MSKCVLNSSTCVKDCILFLRLNSYGKGENQKLVFVCKLHSIYLHKDNGKKLEVRTK